MYSLILNFILGIPKQDDRNMGFQVEVTAKLMANMGWVERQTSYGSDLNDWGYFSLLTVSNGITVYKNHLPLKN